jgi:hypothetical protein
MNKTNFYKFVKEHAEKDKEEVFLPAVAAVVLMKKKYLNVVRELTTRSTRLHRQISYLLTRAVAFLLLLLIKLSANMKVKKIEEEEFVQENHLNLLRKNVRKEDLLVKNHVHQRNLKLQLQKRNLALIKDQALKRDQRNQKVLANIQKLLKNQDLIQRAQRNGKNALKALKNQKKVQKV